VVFGRCWWLLATDNQNTRTSGLNKGPEGLFLPKNSFWNYQGLGYPCASPIPTSELLKATYCFGGTILRIGDRLRSLREEKNFSQGDIEKKTGLLRCYVSRVENGHTVPSVDTLEKFARALEVPMYQLFYEGEQPPQLPNLLKRKTTDDILWGNSGEDARLLAKFCRLFGRMKNEEFVLILFLAQKLALRKALQEDAG
jgi:transcriptional regulator with XRE-family HTH domain